MCGVINAIDERNLFVITFHRNELPVDHEEAAESLGVAVLQCDMVVVREQGKFPDELTMCSADSLQAPLGQCTCAGTFQVKRKQRLRCFAMIHGKPMVAVGTLVAFQAFARAFFPRMQTVAIPAGKMASGSVFFTANMFNWGNCSNASADVTISGAWNGTLSAAAESKGPVRICSNVVSCCPCQAYYLNK